MLIEQTLQPLPPQRVLPGELPIAPDAPAPRGAKVPPPALPAESRVSVRAGGDPSVAPPAARPAPQLPAARAPEPGRSGGPDR